MNDVTREDVRRVRHLFLVAGPTLDELLSAADRGELPDARKYAKAGAELARLPDSVPMRLIARATKRTPAGVAKHFTPLQLGLLLTLMLAQLPDLFRSDDAATGTPATPTTLTDPDVLTRWLTTPPAPSRN
ncbi:hypothetical protein [Limnoglobus roseus]|uniref:Uncharacterized protein n=1 Tax=Limnoglobus roseus TaxID=2598579 RepID=A0A5C1AMV5_9BACT|nr:hypothetical protein [Limnoglobus roseus]QEL19905.1 hypothetical protein PX52LOC_06987 [Limnoglobus roseus]